MAIRDIPKGRILFAERPIVSCLNEDKLGEYCSYCFNLLAFSEAESDGFDTFHIDCNDIGAASLFFKYSGVRNRHFAMNQNRKFPVMARLILGQTLAHYYESTACPWNGILGRLCFEDKSERVTDREPYDEYMKWLVDEEQFDYDELQRIVPFELYDRCIRILHRNCMQINYEDDAIGTALFGLGSFFNHSCRPNVQLSDKMQSQSAYAMFESVQNIKKGSELCLQYVDSNDFGSNDEKQKYLMFAYGFYCQCSLCLSAA